MRVYGKVKIVFWEDEKITTLEDAPKLLALYCLTGEHSNAIGCYRLPLGYIKTDLHWTEEKAQESLDALIKAGFLLYDYETQFMMICNYLKHNPIENSRVGKMCVSLVNSVMRSKNIFPTLIDALRPQKHRFIMKEKNYWNSSWNSLCHSVYEEKNSENDTLSHSLSNSVSHTVSNTLSDTVSSNIKQSAETQGIASISDVAPDTLSDRVSSTLHNFVPPEPEPEPEPEYKDDDDLRVRDLIKPIDIIKIFDTAIIEVFGAEQERPWPHANDMSCAKDFIKVGATAELCRDIFMKHQHLQKRKGKFPIASLSYFKNAIPETIREQQYHQEAKNDTTAISKYSGSSGKKQPQNAHDAFTEAAITVLDKRQQD